jgi:hypothetical protein
MAVETRKNQKYFYRKRRIGKRVVSEYIGGSEFDLLLARWAKKERMIERHEKNLLEAERYELEEIDRRLDALETKINEILTAFLIGEGFYKTTSREWRI